MSGVMRNYNQRMPERQIDALRALREQTGLSVSELIRRMFDYCIRDHVFNEIVPAMSGQVSVGR